MSAQELRDAAALMRKRVRAATGSPWIAFSARRGSDYIHGVTTDLDVDYGADVFVGCSQPDAIHIASWHPAVALAVADWLDATAREFDALGDPDLSAHPQDGRRTAALAVARTYLGSAS